MTVSGACGGAHAAVQVEVSFRRVVPAGPAACADEVWIYAPLGLRGFMALMRRISWRRFDGVVQPMAQPYWLKYLVWPRPPWRQGLGDTQAQ